MGPLSHSGLQKALSRLWALKKINANEKLKYFIIFKKNFGDPEVWTEGLGLAYQAFYHLSHGLIALLL
jgi:hypothetical protein